MRKLKLTGFLLFIFQFWLPAQFSCPELGSDSKDRLSAHISYLASDELQGREPGTEGAEKAAAYIEKEFKKIGLDPVTEEAYRQVFTIPTQVQFNENNQFSFKGKDYELRKDYFPVQWSENGSAEGNTVFVNYGITAPDLEHDDYQKLKPEKLQDRIFVMDISSPDGVHPHSKFLKYHDLGERISLAREKGAAGVILINPGKLASDLSPAYKKIHSKKIPVIFVSNEKLAQKIKKDKRVKFTTDISAQRILAYNIVGMINNNAPTTVIIGAHYDHLGTGAENSLHAGDEPAIHNGADDNASGVAGMLELAQQIANGGEEYQAHNYLFAAFSGEEKGLLGSSFFVENMRDFQIEPKFMINLDMLGRLEDNQLAINGTGTSPHWPDLIREKGCNDLRIKTSSAGVGPSDHTSFYRQEIPALHFFTGTHQDYHKPTDDPEKINYEGEAKILGYILGLLQEASGIESFTFTPTDSETQEAPRFNVTLGVMPDYMFEGEGMRIDGVTEGKPASRAGLEAGDVVVQLGEVKVVDMMSYMKALGQFNKGDAADLKYVRNDQTFTTQVKF